MLQLNIQAEWTSHVAIKYEVQNNIKNKQIEKWILIKKNRYVLRKLYIAIDREVEAGTDPVKQIQHIMDDQKK